MSNVEKVTLSLPTELLARIENLRRDHPATRSAVVSELLWRGWQLVENEQREARYRVAYAAQPETDQELVWAKVAADELLTPDWCSDVEGFGSDPPEAKWTEAKRTSAAG